MFTDTLQISQSEINVSSFFRTNADLFRENPAPINAVVIKNAFDKLLGLDMQNVPLDSPFSIDMPIRLSTRDSQSLQLEFFYIGEFDHANDPSLSVELRTSNTSSEFISKKYWAFDVRPEGILITSRIDTKSNWESNGFGTSLELLTNDVIQHALKHFTRLPNVPVIARIHDTANSPRKVRDKWTSFYALALGYSPDPGNLKYLYKRYR